MKPGLYVATVQGVEVHVWHDGASDGLSYFVLDVRDSRWLADDAVTDARPLVVLDPESDDDCHALMEAARQSVTAPGGMEHSRSILRALAAPTPAEPMGLGAVVRDKAGVLWVRARLAKEQWRRAAERDSVLIYAPWSEIDSPEVLSEGWSA